MDNFDRIVHWVKNTENNQWYDLLRLNLDAPYFAGKSGVYDPSAG